MAEDEVWYSNAYQAHNFFQPFLHPVAGYFQTVGRGVALFSLLFDIRFAPLVLNIFAIVIEILPALFFLSRRFEKTVSNFWHRFLVAFLYLALPATFETNANITNAQWRLSLLAFLIIIAAPNKKTWEKIFDNFFLLLSGLSGPFVFFLVPILFLHRYFSQYKKRVAQFFILMLALLVQVWGILGTTLGFYSQDGRIRAHLSWNILVLLKLITGKIFVAGTLGLSRYSEIKNLTWWQGGMLPVLFAFCGFFMLGYTFWKANLELKLFLIFAFFVFASGLLFPQKTWENMLDTTTVNRYFFLPILAWVLTLVWLTFKSPSLYIKYFATLVFAALIVFGIPHDWIFPKFKDWQYQRQVGEFEKLPSGQAYVFKTVPGWTMTLTKK